jgi:hypothetical protein
MNFYDKNGTIINIGDKIKINVDKTIMGDYIEYHGNYMGVIVEHEMFGIDTPVFESLNEEPLKCLILPMSDMKYGELQIL